MNSYPPAPDASMLGSVFARGPVSSEIRYEPIRQPADYLDQYPNVHLTTVELPAVYSAAAVTSGAAAMPVHQSIATNNSTPVAAETVQQQVPGTESALLPVPYVSAITAGNTIVTDAIPHLTEAPSITSSMAECITAVEQELKATGQSVSSQPEALLIPPSETSSAAAEAATPSVGMLQLQVDQTLATQPLCEASVPIAPRDVQKPAGWLAESSSAMSELDIASPEGPSVPAPLEQQVQQQDEILQLPPSEQQLQPADEDEYAIVVTEDESGDEAPGGNHEETEAPGVAQPTANSSHDKQGHSSTGGGKKRKKHKRGKKKGHKA